MPITRAIRSPARLTDPSVYDLGHVGGEERLIIWRHRQSAGRCGPSAYPNMPMHINQAEAARRLGLDPYAYNRMENGKRTMMGAEEAQRLAALLEPVEPTTADRCFLARRRSGARVDDVAQGLGVTKPKFYNMERLGDPAVVRFWEARGFRFPP